MNRLSGKVAVITGGTRGFGLALARAYAVEGAALVVGSRSLESVERALEELRSRGFRATGRAVEVSEYEQVKALSELALSEFGRLDIWVNNAGMAGPYGPTVDFEPGTFRQIMNTNMLGVYYGSRVAMKHFLAQGAGKLINLLGYGSRRPAPYQNAYGASKAWVRNFTLALAQETQESGVGVYAFSPGMVITEMLTRIEVIRGTEERLKRYPTVLQVLAKPPEAAVEKAIWLASSATDGKTGLVVQAGSRGGILRGAPREIFRVLTDKPVEEIEVEYRTVPPAD